MFFRTLTLILIAAAFAATEFRAVAAEPVSPRNANGSIRKAIPQPDGKVIVAGPFSYIGQTQRAGIARLNSDGTLDQTFDSGSGANGSIDHLALQSDGKILIGGVFTSVSGTARAGIARLNANGTLDSTFDPGTGADGEVFRMLVDANNKVVLGGNFGSFNSVARYGLVRLNLDGTVDLAFDAAKNFTAVGPPGPGAIRRVLDFAFYPDGQLIVIGIFNAGGKFSPVRVAVDGTVDQSFVVQAISNKLVAAQPDGRVLIGDGMAYNRNGSLVRANADGQQDITFQAFVTPRALRLQADGRILVIDQNEFRRLLYNGSVDPTFTSPQLGSGRPATFPMFAGVEPQDDGRILIYGSFNSVNGIPRVGVARLLQDGSVDPTFVPEPSFIATGFALNLSTRAQAGAGPAALIGGFMVVGDAPKKVMIRAIGPSLASSSAPIKTPLGNPRVTLRDSSGEALAQNDDWKTTQTGGLITANQAGEIEASGIAPTQEKESAFIVTLPPAAYTAVLEGSDAVPGTALVEIYDLDSTAAARIANISTRGAVQTGENVMIGGVILGGAFPTEVLVRAMGPSLTQSGVSGALPDPQIGLYNANGFLVGSNDNWKRDNKAEIESTEAAPTDDREAAIVTILQPGNYTAVVTGENGSTGIALVEFYAL